MPQMEKLESRRLMDAGDVDETFGAGGFVEQQFAGMHIYPPDLSVGAQGEIVMSAVVQPDPAAGADPVVMVWKMHADGTPFATFRDLNQVQGRTQLSIPDRAGSAILRRAKNWIMPDGRILVQTGQQLWMLDSRGRIDRSFGRNGQAFFNTFKDDRVNVDVDSQGRIYVAGGTNFNTAEDYSFRMIRMARDGMLDQTFGDGGFVDSPLIPSTTGGVRMKLVGGGKILVSAARGISLTTLTEYTAVRFTSDGSVDTSYGTNGRSQGTFGGGGAIDDEIIQRASPGQITRDGFATFTFEDSDDIHIGAFDADGEFVEQYFNEPTLESYGVESVKDDALFFARSNTALNFLDSSGVRITGPSDTATNAATINPADRRFGALELENDGSILVVSEGVGEGPERLGNAMRVYKLFRDDGPVGLLDARNLATTRAASYKLRVYWRDGDGIDESTLGDDDVTVLTPGGTRRHARLVDSSTLADGSVLADYIITTPGGIWDQADNGTYTARVERRGVRDVDGNAVAQRAIGTFAVAVPMTVLPAPNGPKVAVIDARRDLDFDELAGTAG